MPRAVTGNVVRQVRTPVVGRQRVKSSAPLRQHMRYAGVTAPPRLFTAFIGVPRSGYSEAPPRDGGCARAHARDAGAAPPPRRSIRRHARARAARARSVDSRRERKEMAFEGNGGRWRRADARNSNGGGRFYARGIWRYMRKSEMAPAMPPAKEAAAAGSWRCR